ncbi:MAG: hypothetical protein ACYTG0_39870 [Planctomycetota bacterium]
MTKAGVGDGLCVVDWIMEPGSDEAWRDEHRAKGRYIYTFNNDKHGKRPKRMIEDPGSATR